MDAAEMQRHTTSHLEEKKRGFAKDKKLNLNQWEVHLI
jgi:hypothetical protein